jgi:hypothetical protein
LRKAGIVLIVLGAAGFAWAQSVLGGYDSVEGALKSTFSSSERSRKSLAENGRWAALAVGVVGLILVLSPGRRG